MARGTIGWVGQVATMRGDVWVHILRAGHARRWVYRREFDRGAVDFFVTDRCGMGSPVIFTRSIHEEKGGRTLSEQPLD